ncbi:MAG TPA: fibronectin type III domain-containing protein, partial [bacterium]|nr:fibronectin type III domain-containing protein [bacterium]
MTKPKNNAYLRTLRAAALPALAVLALAGCDDDKIVYVDDIPPAIPTGVFTVTGDQRVDIYWNPVRESDVEGYGVYWSDQLNGTYQRLATVNGVESNHYVDFDVQNGVTYFYAVDSFDFGGNESELSYEAAFDTPRPDGAGVTVWARLDQPSESGIDFSDWNSSFSFVTAWDAPDTDVYFQTVGPVLYAKGTLINNFWNDIQDL